MNLKEIPAIRNCETLPLAKVPVLDRGSFRNMVVHGVQAGLRICAMFGMPESKKVSNLIAVLGDDSEGTLSILSTRVEDYYPSLTPSCPQAHMFEREIAEQWGIKPEDHPWLKPVRFHDSYSSRRELWPVTEFEPRLPSVTDFFRVKGDEVHQVAVGPVHAGVIEPGHFRFQCHGEEVFHLEISLGYQHRGIEKALLGGPHKRSLYHMEAAAGDTSIGHSTAYCWLLEALSGMKVPPRAQAIRAVALELERLANHVGDLGALAQDVGYLPTSSFCGRIRGDFLNMSALVCGSRFGRGLLRPGGVRFDIDEPERLEELIKRLKTQEKDALVAINLLWDMPSVMARFEDTGQVTLEDSTELGLVGVAARASGLNRDVRRDHPYGHYAKQKASIAKADTGCVYARAMIRFEEIQNSLSFIYEALENLPDGNIYSEGRAAVLKPNAITVSLVEGWRGELCHVAVTDSEGVFRRYKVVDPSFHNWSGLAMALRGQEISDFPLCNKSFNLSYSGFDL